MAAYKTVAVAGSAASPASGNNTHTAVEFITKANAQVAFEFIVDTVGGTPTVTWKLQGSQDGTNFYDLAYVTDANDTVAVATRTATAVGNQISFVSNTSSRAYRYYRAVTTSNTNITYHVVGYSFDTRP